MSLLFVGIDGSSGEEEEEEGEGRVVYSYL